jgi:hypothetical protein
MISPAGDRPFVSRNPAVHQQVVRSRRNRFQLAMVLPNQRAFRSQMAKLFMDFQIGKQILV